MNKFSDMSTFVAVVEAGSFSEAARRLGTTKSIVSQRIRNLEMRLDCPLLTRGRPLQTTEAGFRFFEQSRQLLQELEHIEGDVQNSGSSPRGTLKLAVPGAFITHQLAPLLSRFAAKYPALCLDVEADDRRSNFGDGHFDAAIRIGQLVDSNLIARTVAVNHHLICASPAYLDRRGVPRHPDDLLHHDGLVYLNREPNGMWTLPFGRESKSFRVRVRMRTDSGHQLLAGAMDGLGLAILPTFLASNALLSGELLPVLPDYAPAGGHISLLYRKSVRTPAKIQSLIRFLTEEIGHPTDWDAPLIERGILSQTRRA
ncbi:LysR family transcriptional regulator [Burkholderia cenocepacia]|uniref:LysR family transcriptional regulator n=1 Tax=Burkholderia cenocepacia TaxID=95486 RepID=UPI000481FCA0|nr:LysR family transcriptional regulator [Burkholderia cenocepacia]KOR21460.1 LysR family transcriptional regulator [Burkholderia cenocepacia]MBR7979851.1 LysR family transcriptional regulator [Burkholderia cenocepacia]MBR7995023.1 LysR family transcriptional regulator [Burkholderia cenocepacia]